MLLAGGQGTRLGLDRPKGTLNIGVNRELYLFEQLFRNLMDVTDEAGAYVPMYIMTSNINHKDTVTFFEEHHYFGYPKDYVKFFIQEMVPACDHEDVSIWNLISRWQCLQTETVDGLVPW